MKNVDKNEFREKRQLISLRRKVIEGRKRWEKLIQPHVISIETTKGKSERSPLKKLYFVNMGAWWEPIQKEMEKIELKIARADNKVEKGSRGLWLPTVIKDAKRVTIKQYSAVSVRKCYDETAEEFARKSGHTRTLLKKWHTIASLTGIDYALGVHSSTEKKHYPFTDWAVCLCKDGILPTLSKLEHKPVFSEKRLIYSICTYGNSLLFIRKGTKSSQPHYN
ncbi:hypothetical protein [Methylotenera sp.]|uniref:hypothetical protein n=1 Tax=Methylotenera sp. TaxID=2051956 RepID=UPI00248999EA|nr:hypothetical protein [Methylotenera sp.]MDI1298069.1 hypothetical protein [Methylotenera sp.]